MGFVRATLALTICVAAPSEIHIERKKLSVGKTVATVGGIAGGSEKGTDHEGKPKWRLIW